MTWTELDLSAAVLLTDTTTYDAAAGTIQSDGTNWPYFAIPGLVLQSGTTYTFEVDFASTSTYSQLGLQSLSDDTAAALASSSGYELGLNDSGSGTKTPLDVTTGPGMDHYDQAMAVSEYHVAWFGGAGSVISGARWMEGTPPVVPNGTNTINRAGGRVRRGSAMVTIDTPVVAPPDTLTVVYPKVKATPLKAATVTATGNVTGWETQRAVVADGARDRILIDGKDVTYFRDRALQVPDYTLTEPLAYDASSLTVPQVHPNVEALGVGELRWARKGAKVVYQRVFADGSKVTDYRGVVLAVRSSGGQLVLDIGGQISGPANLRDEQPPLRWKPRELGWWAWHYIGQEFGTHFTPRLGPTTGIKITNPGQMTTLAWLQQICAMSQVGTTQRTLMPKVWGGNEWRFDVKDTTTVDCTIFLDGTRAAEDLVDDVSEQPNTWYGTGVTPTGLRVRNSHYPGLTQGPAPAYPMAGGASFGTGTTDADTIDGKGVQVLQIKLLWEGYLEQADLNSGTYDAATEAAVRRLQRDVGLSVTGTVDQATWNRLFDVDATGYSFAASRIFPLVQDPRVPGWLYTSNGSIAGANPQRDPRILRVDRTIDFGGGVTKGHMIDWCESQMERLSGKNWAGTITLTDTGVFRGQWSLGDSPTSADVMSHRDIRPGMNAWLPGFDGGTLVHISGVQVSGGTATLTVDTMARDLLELSQVIQRNRDSRRNIRREWKASNRVGAPANNFVTHDEYFGVLDHDLQLTGNQWNVVPIIAGQTGQVGRVDILCNNAPAEFCVAVLSRKVSPVRLQRRVGDPFPVNSNGESVWETGRVQDWMDDKTLLFAAGTEKQPCGYGPNRRKYGVDANGNQILTGAPLTGRYTDDAGFGYVTQSDEWPVLWLAIYPDRDTVLQSGRLLYVLEDDAA